MFSMSKKKTSDIFIQLLKKNKYFVLKDLRHILQYIYKLDASHIINLFLNFAQILRSNFRADLIKIDNSCNPKVDCGDRQHQRWEHLLL